MSRNKVVKYKVWVHIEGLNEDGDPIEGDEYFEPIEAACVKTSEDAVAIQTELEARGKELQTLFEDAQRKGRRK